MAKKTKKSNKKVRNIVMLGISAVVLLASISVIIAYAVITNGSPDIVAKPAGFGEGDIEQDPNLEFLDDGEVPDGNETEENITEGDLMPIYEIAQHDPNIINILLCGCDDGTIARSRSDSMIIASYNKKTKVLKLVSMMRDSWVPIEGLGYNRLNASHSYGGVGCTINTINNVFHMDLQQYLEVGFNEFSTLINKIDGVDVQLNAKEASKLGIGSKAGTYHLNGTTALLYARERHIGNGEFERTERQRKVIQSAFKKIKKNFNVSTLTGLISFAMSNIRTNMEMDTILELATDFMKNDITIETSRMPYDGYWKNACIEKKSVITIDYDENEKLLKEFLYGTSTNN